MEPRGASQGIWVPGIVLPGRQHTSRVGGCRNANAGTHVRHRSRLLEEDDRCLTRGRKHCVQIEVRAARDGDHPGPRGLRREIRHDGGVKGGDALDQGPRQVRRQVGGQPLQLLRIDGDRLNDVRAETEGMLQGVKSLQDGEPAGLAGPPGNAESGHRSRRHHDRVERPDGARSSRTMSLTGASTPVGRSGRRRQQRAIAVVEDLG